MSALFRHLWVGRAVVGKEREGDPVRKIWSCEVVLAYSQKHLIVLRISKGEVLIEGFCLKVILHLFKGGKKIKTSF